MACCHPGGARWTSVFSIRAHQHKGDAYHGWNPSGSDMKRIRHHGKETHATVRFLWENCPLYVLRMITPQSIWDYALSFCGLLGSVFLPAQDTVDTVNSVGKPLGMHHSWAPYRRTGGGDLSWIEDKKFNHIRWFNTDIIYSQSRLLLWLWKCLEVASF